MLSSDYNVLRSTVIAMNNFIQSSHCQALQLFRPTRILINALTSDVSESFLSSQSHKPLESESSKVFSIRVRVMIWLSRVRVESLELSSHFESLVCKLESMSSHTKFHVFSATFFCYEIAPDKLENGALPAMKWHPTN